jgi:hypothetical protein
MSPSSKKPNSGKSKTAEIRGNKREKAAADGWVERAVRVLFAALARFQGAEIDRMSCSSDHGLKLNVDNNLWEMKASILVVYC